MSQDFLYRSLNVNTGSPITKLLLVKLADNADQQGYCFPSYGYLAKCCEVSVRTVKVHIKILVEQGLLTKTSRFSPKGMQRSNVFQLCLPELIPTERRVDEGAPAAPITNKTKINNLEGGSSPQDVITLATSDGEKVIDSAFYQVLLQTYPGLDVLQELKAMRIWLHINEAKRKPAHTIKYFVNCWLRRAMKAQSAKDEITTLGKVHQPKTSITDKALASYQQRPQKHPIEARIKRLIEQSKSPSCKQGGAE
ncbi:helix-turn-helix domain-containing protein [Vibrio astriarenae]|uniref:helix-turn-helix domain-containing protein n=1 Tax=Vibrio astriarenae TaxID=1481923 RepID=UPI0037364C5E